MSRKHSKEHAKRYSAAFDYSNGGFNKLNYQLGKMNHTIVRLKKSLAKVQRELKIEKERNHTTTNQPI